MTFSIYKGLCVSPAECRIAEMCLGPCAGHVEDAFTVRFSAWWAQFERDPRNAGLLADPINLARAAFRAGSFPNACILEGHVWVGTGDGRVVCDECDYRLDPVNQPENIR